MANVPDVCREPEPLEQAKMKHGDEPRTEVGAFTTAGSDR
jgi:hypothetical protein